MKIHKKELAKKMIDAQMNFSDISKASGVSRCTLSRIYNGAETTFDTIEKISKALGISVWDLIAPEEPSDVITEEVSKNENPLSGIETEFEAYIDAMTEMARIVTKWYQMLIDEREEMKDETV